MYCSERQLSVYATLNTLYISNDLVMMGVKAVAQFVHVLLEEGTTHHITSSYSLPWSHSLSRGPRDVS